MSLCGPQDHWVCQRALRITVITSRRARCLGAHLFLVKQSQGTSSGRHEKDVSSSSSYQTWSNEEFSEGPVQTWYCQLCTLLPAKESFFVRPKIQEIVMDKVFEELLTINEARAWEAFKSV